MTWNRHTTHVQDGDLVLLAGQKHKHFIITLKAGMDFHTHRGILLHDDLIGLPWGTQVYSHTGAPFYIFSPSLADVLRDIPRNTQILYPKDSKPKTSREVHPELRQMRFKIDNYTCQKCGKHQGELKVGLHCHHIEGIRWEPLESADLDKCITVCKNCHLEIHKKEGCGYHDMQCKEF